MGQLHITGQRTLNGNLRISGRKNAALKLLAACLLSDQPITLRNVPDIGDVRTMRQILEAMGAEITTPEPTTYVVNTASVTDPTIPYELGRKLRASLVLVGPLLARFGKAHFPHPGGCVIGKRSIAPHLDAFERLGAAISFDGTSYQITADHLTGSEIYLKERSVTGTENLLMAAVGAEGITHIYNAAEEPHITNLAELLQQMGYEIKGEGTSHLIISGKPGQRGVSADCTIIPDEIEVGTYAVAAALTHGTVTLEKVGRRELLHPILSKLDDFGVNYTYNPEEESLTIHSEHHFQAATVQTGTWPGFPSDLQSPFAILATQAEGTSLIHDWMYDGRIYFVDLLQKMGAECTVCDPHRAIITGPTPLHKNSLITPDLRAGAALVLAALCAEGTSTIDHCELIERGYAHLVENLTSLGAQITRED